MHTKRSNNFKTGRIYLIILFALVLKEKFTKINSVGIRSVEILNISITILIEHWSNKQKKKKTQINEKRINIALMSDYRL